MRSVALAAIGAAVMVTGCVNDNGPRSGWGGATAAMTITGPIRPTAIMMRHAIIATTSAIVSAAWAPTIASTLAVMVDTIAVATMARPA